MHGAKSIFSNAKTTIDAISIMHLSMPIPPLPIGDRSGIDTELTSQGGRLIPPGSYLEKLTPTSGGIAISCCQFPHLSPIGGGGD